MIHFMINEATMKKQPNWTNRKKRKFTRGPKKISTDDSGIQGDIWDDSEFTNQKILNKFRSMDPDHLYTDETESITFVYDHNKDIIYHGDFPVTHADILRSREYWSSGNRSYEIPEKSNAWDESTGESERNYDDDFDDSFDDEEEEQEPEQNPVSQMMGLGWRADRFSAIRAGFALGRIGSVLMEEDEEEITCIGFWNENIKEDLLKKTVQALIRKWSWLNDERTVVFGTYGRGVKPIFLRDLGLYTPKQTNQPAKSLQRQVNPVCKDASTINVAGQPMTLGVMLGNLHMVKGDQLQKMHAAFCGAEKGLRKRLDQGGCDHELDMLDSIASRFKQHSMQCSDDWNDILQKGKTAYRQELKGKFQKAADAVRSGDDSDPLGTEFRTQKELDAAWDYINKREHKMPSFTEWLTLKVENEAQRRSGSITGPASHPRDGRRLRPY